MRHLTLMLAISIAVAGCATNIQDNQTRIVVSSSPPGAIITTKGRAGTLSHPAPTPIVWTHQKGSYIDTVVIGATWPSGATTTARLNLYAGQDAAYVMQRPNVPGLERDMQYANAAAAKAADSSADGAIFLLNSATVTMDAYAKSKQSTTMKTANCTSTKGADGTIDTQCTERGW